MKEAKPPRRLVLVTLCFLITILAVGFYIAETELPPAVQINVKGQPTIGYPKAKVQVVIFEEPKCSNCREFNNEIFPKLKAEYIDTNKILYTVIPVSFLPNSMLAAISLYCVYYDNPVYPNSEQFFNFLDYMYMQQPDEHVDWVRLDELLKYAKNASPAINTRKLSKCLEMETYRIKVEKNTEYGKSIMGGMISTPTLFVNGIEVKELTYDEIKKVIRTVLEHEGAH